MAFDRSGRATAAAGGTGGSDRLAFARELLRLSRATHLAAAEPVARKRAMLDGLRRLASAQRAMSVVTEIDPRTGRSSVVSVVSVNGTQPDAATGHNGDVGGPAVGVAAVGGAAARRRGRGGRTRNDGPASPTPAAGDGPCVDVFLSLDGVRLVACLTICRRAGDARFSAADRALVELVHAECGWVYEHDRLVAGDALADLDPRGRQVLQGLVSGQGEKQIADRWQMNVHTVHQHVKALYRRFGVTSRAQLMARWTGGHRPAGDEVAEEADAE